MATRKFSVSMGLAVYKEAKKLADKYYRGNMSAFLEDAVKVAKKFNAKGKLVAGRRIMAIAADGGKDGDD